MAKDARYPERGEKILAEKLKAKGKARREALKSVAQLTSDPRPPRNDLTPTLELLTIPLDELLTYTRKLRQNDPSHVRDVAEGIRKLGFCNPILIGSNNVVIDGEARLEAAKLLGLSSVPAIKVGHLNADEQRVLRLAVNRLGENGQWDLDQLKLEFEELAGLDTDMALTGFTGDEMDHILLDEDAVDGEVGPLQPEEGMVSIAKLGDMFQLGAHLIICGSATDPVTVERLMSGAEPARLILTDEPYNVKIKGNVSGKQGIGTKKKHKKSVQHREFVMGSGEMSDDQFMQFNLDWIAISCKYLCDGGVFSTFIDWRGLTTVNVAAAKLGLTPLNLIVWTKTNAGMGALYRSKHELLPMFKKGEAQNRNNIMLGANGRYRTNVWEYPGASARGSDARKGLMLHPTVKPTAMLEDTVLDLTDRGDMVMDPFLGSGSTLIAAEKTGRICRGIELDPLYVDVIIRRFEELTGTEAVLIERFQDVPQEALDAEDVIEAAAEAVEPLVVEDGVTLPDMESIPDLEPSEAA